MFSGGDARCNDGSKAGFYYRLSPKSRKWIVFLEGGWYCFDLQSCRARWKSSGHLMTSAGWPKLRNVGGILSADPQENPHWWRSNHVYVPYCSSDCWSGTRRGSTNVSFSLVHTLFSGKNSWFSSSNGTMDVSDFTVKDLPFQGAIILEKVVMDLLTLGLSNGHKLILAGSSAGGLGVFLNVDRIHALLSNLGFKIDVRGIADSAWFLDNEPFAPMNCQDALTCPPKEAVRTGHNLWNSHIPSKCRAEFEKTPWDCYLGYKILPTIRRPLFVFQWIFDEAQMMLDNVGKPVSKQQWNYIHSIGERVMKSFSNVSAVFAPSCISHTALTSMTWSDVKIGHVSLSDALHCWSKINENTKKKSIETNEQPASSSLLSTADEIQNVSMSEADGHHKAVPFLTENEVSHERKEIRHIKKKHKCRKCRKRSKHKGSKHKKVSEELSSSLDDATVLARADANVSAVTMLADSPGIIEQSAPSDKTEFKKVNEKKKRKRDRKRNKQRRNKRRRKKLRKKERRKEKRRRRRREKGQILKGQRQRQKDHRRITRSSYVNSSVTEEKLLGRLKDFPDRSGPKEKSLPHSEETEDEEEEDEDGKSTCHLHLVDRCSWPHCNPSCPLLINPYTGEEMNRVQLLKSFGLNMVDLATALGIDMATLKAMDNKDIFLILTP